MADDSKLCQVCLERSRKGGRRQPKIGRWVLSNQTGMRIALCEDDKVEMERLDVLNRVIGNSYRRLYPEEDFTPVTMMTQLPVGEVRADWRGRNVRESRRFE